VNRIRIDLERTLGDVHRHIFGGFAEHVGHVIYGGIFDPQSSLAAEDGLRRDVREALQSLSYTIVRYPGAISFPDTDGWTE